jgi:hypothetical protein
VEKQLQEMQVYCLPLQLRIAPHHLNEFRERNGSRVKEGKRNAHHGNGSYGLRRSCRPGPGRRHDPDLTAPPSNQIMQAAGFPAAFAFQA